jgi:hypothetical protein
MEFVTESGSEIVRRVRGEGRDGIERRKDRMCGIAAKWIEWKGVGIEKSSESLRTGATQIVRFLNALNVSSESTKDAGYGYGHKYSVS